MSEPALDAPCEIRRVDRKTLPTNTRAGRESQVSKRLRTGSVDGSPDVDAEVSCKHRQLVDEGHVHVTEGVLEQLHELRLGSRSDRYGLLDQGTVEGLDCLKTARVAARDDFGCIQEGPGQISGVDALRGIPEKHVFTDPKPGA